MPLAWASIPWSLALELLLPRACVACGAPLLVEFARPAEAGAWAAPLCSACARGLCLIPEPRCTRCGRELISEAGLCMGCRDRAWSFDEAYPLFEYEGKFRAILGAYKFHDRRTLGPFLASLLSSALDARWPGRPIVPVPPRPGKIRTKGWDQVECLARLLERRGRRVCRLLVRMPSAQQKRLGQEARSANARLAYRLRPGACPPGSLVLLDDVLTTGATAEACARALREGGAEKIAVLALASES